MSKSAMASEATKPIVVAHRGASGYLPEHTLEAQALAYGMGADYIETDVVLSKDAVPIVLHDVYLDSTTNVAQIFPQRKRPDGKFYAIDFTLKEIKSLAVHERVEVSTGKTVFSGRFPLAKSQFQIPTLREHLELILGLNKSTGKKVGFYPEIKSPEFHEKAGHDITKIVYSLLREYGLDSSSEKIFIQCFDPRTLKRLKKELKVKIPLIQLLGENEWKEASVDYDYYKSKEGLKEIATYAVGIGPWIGQLFIPDPQGKKMILSSLAPMAKELGLMVHPYTLRADDLPFYVKSHDDFLRELLEKAKVDGVFTDHPDLTVQYLQKESPK